MANKTNLSIGMVIVVLVAAYFGIDLQENQLKTSISSLNLETSSTGHKPQNATLDDAAKIAEAFQKQKSNFQVQSQGRVVAVLKDDNDGSRHQKFILELNQGLTVLVAHNIDLSSRLEGLKKGDRVAFNGAYEYSPQGGVIHWTHHDPQKNHVDGWLKYNGRTYQ
jgi:molybdopterin converting factor small subunit